MYKSVVIKNVSNYSFILCKNKPGEVRFFLVIWLYICFSNSSKMFRKSLLKVDCCATLTALTSTYLILDITCVPQTAIFELAARGGVRTWTYPLLGLIYMFSLTTQIWWALVLQSLAKIGQQGKFGQKVLFSKLVVHVMCGYFTTWNISLHICRVHIFPMQTWQSFLCYYSDDISWI